MAHQQTLLQRYAHPFILMSLLSPVGSIVPLAVISMVMLSELSGAVAIRVSAKRKRQKIAPQRAAQEGDNDNYLVQDFSSGTVRVVKGKDVVGRLKTSPKDDPLRADYPVQEARRRLKEDPTLAYNRFATDEINAGAAEFCERTISHKNGIRKLCDKDGDCHFEMQTMVVCEIPPAGASNLTHAAYEKIAEEARISMINWGQVGLRIPIELTKAILRFFTSEQRVEMIERHFLGYQGYSHVLLSVATPNSPHRLPYAISANPHAILFESTVSISSGMPEDVAALLNPTTPGGAA